MSGAVARGCPDPHDSGGIQAFRVALYAFQAAAMAFACPRHCSRRCQESYECAMERQVRSSQVSPKCILRGPDMAARQHSPCTSHCQSGLSLSPVRACPDLSAAQWGMPVHRIRRGRCFGRARLLRTAPDHGTAVARGHQGKRAPSPESPHHQYCHQQGHYELSDPDPLPACCAGR